MRPSPSALARGPKKSTLPCNLSNISRVTYPLRFRVILLLVILAALVAVVLTDGDTSHT